MRTSLRATAVLLVLAIACVAKFGSSLTAGANEADRPQEGSLVQLTKLRIERVEALREHVKATKAAYDTDSVPLEQLLTANLEQLEAELDVVTARAERVAVFEKMLEQAAHLEAKVKALYLIGAKGGEAEKYFHAKATRLAMEIRLEQERLLK